MNFHGEVAVAPKSSLERGRPARGFEITLNLSWTLSGSTMFTTLGGLQGRVSGYDVDEKEGACLLAPQPPLNREHTRSHHIGRIDCRLGV